MRSLILALVFASNAVAAQDEPTRTLITNVNVFDGVSDRLIEGASVMIEDNLISAVSIDPIDAEGAMVIDGGGRTMTPGFIDAHVHLTLQVNYAELAALDEYYFCLLYTSPSPRDLSTSRMPSSA